MAKHGKYPTVEVTLEHLTWIAEQIEWATLAVKRGHELVEIAPGMVSTPTITLDTLAALLRMKVAKAEAGPRPTFDPLAT